jgi:hypothetical protein
MLRKLTKKGDFTRIHNPPVDSPVFGIHDQWVSYSGHAEWVLPQGLGRNQASRIQSKQSGLQSFELAHRGGNTFILISFIGADRGYFVSSLTAHLRSEDRLQLLDNGRLLLRISTTDDLSHALSVLHQRHQLDPDTKSDLESSLRIKIALTHVDAKLYLLQGRFDEVYIDCLTQPSQHCHKLGHHAIRHYGKEHPEWSIKIYLASRIEDEDRFYFGYSYCYALQHISEMILNGQSVDFDVFDHVDFDTLFATLTVPSKMFKSTHHDFLYYLGIYCREMHPNNISWAIKCFSGVPKGDKNYLSACDALLHLEMQDHCTVDTSGSDLDKAERMLRYALAGIPENRWMAQVYFAHLCGGAGLAPSFPSVDTNADSLVALAKYMRNLHDENSQLKAKVASMESELKKSKADDAGVVMTGAKLFSGNFK